MKRKHIFLLVIGSLVAAAAFYGAVAGILSKAASKIEQRATDEKTLKRLANDLDRALTERVRVEADFPDTDAGHLAKTVAEGWNKFLAIKQSYEAAIDNLGIKDSPYYLVSMAELSAQKARYKKALVYQGEYRRRHTAQLEIYRKALLEALKFEGKHSVKSVEDSKTFEKEYALTKKLSMEQIALDEQILRDLLNLCDFYEKYFRYVVVEGDELLFTEECPDRLVDAHNAIIKQIHHKAAKQEANAKQLNERALARIQQLK